MGRNDISVSLTQTLGHLQRQGPAVSSRTRDPHSGGSDSSNARSTGTLRSSDARELRSAAAAFDVMFTDPGIRGTAKGERTKGDV